MNKIFRVVLRILSISLYLTFAACQNKPSGNLSNDGMTGSSSPFDSSYHQDLSNSMAGNGNTGGTVGSGSSGNLTDADKQALAGMAKDLESVNTKEGGLSQSLLDEAKRILDQEENTDGNAEAMAQIQQAKFALVGKILQECAESVAPLAPVAGQPLMGVWKGNGACPVDFTVSQASGTNQPTYNVTGGTQGRLIASADGRGDLQAQPFKGSLTDAPKAATGRVVHPTFHKTKEGSSNPCDEDATLVTSKNPIPENYLEAMKRLGKCHRQALLFMSPVMDKMFKNMPSNLSSILQRGIGISR